MANIDWTLERDVMISEVESSLAGNETWAVERLLADFPDAALRDYSGETVQRASALGMVLVHVQPDRWIRAWTTSLASAYDRGHELRSHTAAVSDADYYDTFTEPIVLLGAMAIRTGQWTLVHALLDTGVTVSRSSGGTKHAHVAEHVCALHRSSWPQRLERVQDALLADALLRPDRPLRRAKLTDYDRALLRRSADQFVFLTHVFSVAHGRYGVPLLEAYAHESEIIEPVMRSILSDACLRKTAFGDIEHEALLEAMFGQLERMAFGGSLFNQLEDPDVRKHYREFENLHGRVMA